MATIGHLSSLYKPWPSVHFIDYISSLEKNPKQAVSCFVINFFFVFSHAFKKLFPFFMCLNIGVFFCNLSQFLLFKNFSSWLWIRRIIPLFLELLLLSFQFSCTVSYRSMWEIFFGGRSDSLLIWMAYTCSLKIFVSSVGILSFLFPFSFNLFLISCLRYGRRNLFLLVVAEEVLPGKCTSKNVTLC